jgi:thioredoxin-related protein
MNLRPAALLLLVALPLAAQDSKVGSATSKASSATANAGTPERKMTDFAAAKAIAKQKNLDLLLEFTGSDWCPLCIQLHEVFATPEFEEGIAASFVVVELDFPQRKQLDEATQKQNQALQVKFRIKGYPTVLLTDSDGKPYAQTGYQEGGAQEYLKLLAKLREKHALRDAELAKAKTKKGIERAKSLAAALDMVDKGLRRHYVEVLDEIVALDSEGKAGLKPVIEKERAMQLLSEKVDALEKPYGEKLGKRDFKGATAVVDEFMAAHKPEGEPLQKLLFFKSIAAANAGDFVAATKLADDALAAAPEGEMAGPLEQIRELFRKRAGQEPGAKDGKK